MEKAVREADAARRLRPVGPGALADDGAGPLREVGPEGGIVPEEEDDGLGALLLAVGEGEDDDVDAAVARRDNGAFLDSLGWVLFKKKDYKEAKKYLLEAVKDEESQHIEIYDHLGDVHLALGEKAEAVKAWKKGLEVAGDSKREKDKKAAVEKKLKENQ